METITVESERIKEPIQISEEIGFIPLETESISSKVFIKDGKIYKLNKRDSLERQKSDIRMLKNRLNTYKDHLPSSEVVQCKYEGQVYTCIIQPIIEGKEIKKLEQKQLENALRLNKDFLLESLKYFFESIKSKKLYPDIVGFPKDPEYFNAINLILEEATNKIILCDVGLSPHQDTLTKYGIDFYESENVKTYTEKMKKFQKLLLVL